ncbi:MAG: hypothetical protein Q7K65_05530 [Candidatus Buchananbacteria bacterium]|nr:hypothetical protein [Candidatus Buchananbacteria bacterium]
MKQSVDNNIIVRAKSGTEIYFQFDVSQFVEDGTKVEVIITGPDNWTTNKTYTIAKKDLNDDSNVTSGTETTSSLEKLPKDGEYNISIRQLDIKTLIKRVVVLGK